MQPNGEEFDHPSDECSVEFKTDLFKLEEYTISTAFTSFGSSESRDRRRDN